MQSLEERDWFTDVEVAKNPFPFLEALRAHGPVYQPPGRDYLVVTGFKETIDILNNSQDFSSAISLAGAALPLPFQPEGSDISSQIDANRDDIMGGDLLVNLDDAAHGNLRALVNRLFTPSRLKANEQFISQLSEQMVRDAVAKGGCEMISEIATPFVTLVIADLLGVPEEDRAGFMEIIAAAPPPGSLNTSENDVAGENNPMVKLGGYFAGYIMDRQANPRNDILSELAHADYPDGTKPRLQDVITLGVLMFGAGQDTSAKILGNALRYIVDVPGLQDELRADPSRIPLLLEEVLRLEGSTKQTARLARRDTKIGDREVPAGTKILVALAASNRDPARWDNPNEFDMNRPKMRDQLTFGRGKHVCPGAPLARVEVRVILKKFLQLTSRIDLDEMQHGPAGSRNFDFEPSFIIRGLTDLHVKFTPSDNFSAATHATA